MYTPIVSTLFAELKESYSEFLNRRKVEAGHGFLLS